MTSMTEKRRARPGDLGGGLGDCHGPRRGAVRVIDRNK